MTRVNFVISWIVVVLVLVISGVIYTISPLRFYEWFQIILVVTALGGAVYGAYYVQKTYPKVSTQWTNGIIPLIIGFFALHIGVAWIWPKIWVESFRQNGFLLTQLTLIFGLYLMSLMAESNKKKRNKAATAVGFALVLFSLVVICVNTWGVIEWHKKWHKLPDWWPQHTETTSQTARVQSVTSSVTFPEIPQDNPDAVEADRFWRDNLHAEDAAQMLWIAKEESDFHQFNPDGTVLHNKTDDSGLMQIHEPDYLDKSKELGYDIYTRKGNLEMALWIYEHDGLKKWTTHEKAEKLARGQGDYNVIAPVGHFGEKIILTRGTMLNPSGPVLFRDDKGGFHEDSNDGVMRPLVISTFVEPQSRTSEPVIVTVSR